MEMFYTQRGRQAYLNGVALPLTGSPATLTETIAAVDIKYLRSGRLSSRLLSTSPFGSLRNLGSSHPRLVPCRNRPFNLLPWRTAAIGTTQPER